jgi:mannose-6-phosphate isomerase-like protein (cupin superfamily)
MWSGVSNITERSSATGAGPWARPRAARSWAAASTRCPQDAWAWPYHYHLANEEAIYVLEGAGTLRIGGDEIRLSGGDYVALPARAEGAHQLVNSSEAVLRYLCFSTMVEPDVTVYPHSGKVGIFGGAAPGGPKEERTFSKFLRDDAEVGYYDGEG